MSLFDAISAELAIFLVWGIAALVLCGTGLLFRWFLRLPWIDLDDLFRAFLLGFVFVLFFGEAYNLIWPIDAKADAIVATLGAIGIALNARQLVQWLPSALRRSSAGLALLLLLLLAWTANHAADYAATFDDGNYHLTVIRWATDHRTPPGLGNLDGHFAFNSATLLYQAFLEIGWLRGRSSHFGNSLIIVSALVFFLIKARRLILDRNRPSWAGIASALALTPLVILVVGSGVSSSETDYPVDVLFLVAAWMTLDFIQTFSADARREGFRFLALGMVLVSLPLIKVSAATFSAVAWPLLLVSWLVRQKIPRPYRVHLAWALVALSLLPGLVWMYRSVLLSGYPLFPKLWFPLPVRWRIPTIYADWSAWYIGVWSRAPYSDSLATGWSWLPIWFRREWRIQKVDGWLLPALVAGLVSYLFATRTRGLRGSPFSVNSLLLWVPPLVAIPTWFLTAPSFRFATGLLWYATALLAATVISRMVLRSPRLGTKVVLGVCLLPFLALSLESRAVGARMFFVPPGPDHGFRPLTTPFLVKKTTKYGVSIYAPDPARCPPALLKCVVWDSPLPAAQNPKDTLAYLKPGQLDGGFQLREPATQWPIEHAAEVAALARHDNLSERQLTIYFHVRPELIQQALRLTGTAARAPGTPGPE